MGDARRRRENDSKFGQFSSGRVLDFARLFHASIDLMVKIVHEQSKKQQPLFDLPCKEGCASCCYQSISWTLPEALLVLDYLDIHPALHPLRDVLPEKIEESISLFRRIPEPKGTFLFHQKISCIFLENQRCVIYEVRPYPCRTYYVGGPRVCGSVPGSIPGPEGCHPDQPDDVIVPIMLNPGITLAYSSWKVLIIKELHLPSGHAYTPFALHFARVLLEGGREKLKQALAAEGIVQDRDFSKVRTRSLDEKNAAFSQNQGFMEQLKKGAELFAQDEKKLLSKLF